MSKLRLCTLDFKEAVKVQISGSVKTLAAGKSINVVELGYEESFGKPHFCGVISEDITNVTKVKLNIKNLEEMGSKNRIAWFESNFPKARILKIENSKILDRLKNTKDEGQPVQVVSAAEIKWSR